MRSPVLLRRVLALAFAASAVAGCASSAGDAATHPTQSRSELNDNPGNSVYQGFELTPAQPRPVFVLTDSHGKRFSFSQTSGHPTFLFFGYTNCPDVCPTTMADIRIALSHVPRALQAQTYVAFVTTD